MPSRHHIIPGALLLGIAFILSLLVSISVPYVRAFDIVRSTFGTAGGVGSDNTHAVAFRWGVWGTCAELAQSGDWECTSTGYAYSTDVGGQIIGKSWTRGLVIHPITTVIIFVAWLLSFSTHLTVILVASLVSFLGALFALIVFAIDIALFAYVKHKMNSIGGHTTPGPGFWMSLVVLILTTLAGCVVCFHRRHRQSQVGATTSSKGGRGWFRRKNRY